MQQGGRPCRRRRGAGARPIASAFTLRWRHAGITPWPRPRHCRLDRHRRSFGAGPRRLGTGRRLAGDAGRTLTSLPRHPRRRSRANRSISPRRVLLPLVLHSQRLREHVRAHAGAERRDPEASAPARASTFSCPSRQPRFSNEVEGAAPAVSKLSSGHAVFYPGGRVHVVRNVGKIPFHAIMIEFVRDDPEHKAAAFKWNDVKGKTKFNGGTREVLFVKDGVRVSLMTLQPGRDEPPRQRPRPSWSSRSPISTSGKATPRQSCKPAESNGEAVDTREHCRTTANRSRGSCCSSSTDWLGPRSRAESPRRR